MELIVITDTRLVRAIIPTESLDRVFVSNMGAVLSPFALTSIVGLLAAAMMVTDVYGGCMVIGVFCEYDVDAEEAILGCETNLGTITLFELKKKLLWCKIIHFPAVFFYFTHKFNNNIKQIINQINDLFNGG